MNVLLDRMPRCLLCHKLRTSFCLPSSSWDGLLSARPDGVRHLPPIYVFLQRAAAALRAISCRRSGVRLSARAHAPAILSAGIDVLFLCLAGRYPRRQHGVGDHGVRSLLSVWSDHAGNVPSTTPLGQGCSSIIIDNATMHHRTHQVRRSCRVIW